MLISEHCLRSLRVRESTIYDIFYMYSLTSVEKTERSGEWRIVFRTYDDDEGTPAQMCQRAFDSADRSNDWLKEYVLLRLVASGTSNNL